MIFFFFLQLVLQLMIFIIYMPDVFSVEMNESFGLDNVKKKKRKMPFFNFLTPFIMLSKEIFS